MVAVIEPPLLAVLVARVGGATEARPTWVTAPRTIDLPTKVPPANEEDAPAKATTQLK